MLRRAILLGLSTAFLCGPAGAHDIITTKVTWSKEISRLLYRRCASCHAEGQSAFSLMSWDEARPWAKAMKEETGARRMPPWQAVKGFGDFKGDRGLTQEEIELIADWVEGGAPEGDPKFLPARPKREPWQDPALPARSSAVVASDSLRLKSAAHAIAVRPRDLAKGSSVQVIATHPDGTVEPLIWIYRYDPKFARTYYYRVPLDLPAGTVIGMSLPGAGTFTLFSVRP
jgi:hypothetical protein